MTLIEQLQAATEGSLELDTHIHCTVCPERTIHLDLPVGYTMKDACNETANRSLARSKFQSSARGPCPHYTTSIDAALTLIPEGWALMSLNRRIQPDMGGRMWSVTLKGGGNINSGGQRTPALAICIAAMKAREHD